MTTAVSDRISARNQLKGTVTGITSGEAMSLVTIQCGTARFVSAITNEAAQELGLRPNDSVIALIKSTEAMIMKGAVEHVKLSARNKISGQVVEVRRGAAMASVTIDAGGFTVGAAITREAAEDLQIAKGDRVTAVFKATEVILQKA
jgi:molybdate transport system regulatory protein